MITSYRVARIEATLVTHRWDWADGNEVRIRAHWERRRAAQPALYDGRVLMVAGTDLAGNVLHVRFFETGYARLLAHVDLGFPDPTVANGFAMGALRGADGGYLLGTMAPHTANAGRLYFPAGTPDPADVAQDGTVDLGGSILREIEEETGLAPDECTLEPGWTVMRDEGRLALLRGVALAASAEAAAARIRAHLARDSKAELSAISVLRSAAEIDEAAMPAFLPVYLRDAFAKAQR